MSKENINLNNIPASKFEFANQGERLHDRKFEDKPIGYFKDAWIRFRKSRASVIAAVIIIVIVLASIAAPLLITKRDNSLMVAEYEKKPARVTWLRDTIGIVDGGKNLTITEAELIRRLAIGVGAADPTGEDTSLAAGMQSYYQPIMSIGDPIESLDAKKQPIRHYKVREDQYLAEGFIYRYIEQSELQKILDFQEETGLQILYPLIDSENGFTPATEVENANVWYKCGKNAGVPVDDQKRTIPYSEDMVFVDNYLRDENGDVVYWKYSGGGTFETAQLKIRVLYYNHYQYMYGCEPNYILGTESQGYDMALRVADGLQLSLLIAIAVCVINFVLGALYGAVEGYYGGLIDLLLERVSDILNGVPFIVVATLFQLHLAKVVGPLVCLLFAYVVTGWIGTAYRVRAQFYRFKNQEYVMAARTLGAKDSRIIWKHIFPNTLGTLITSSALAIPSTIMSESMLSYLGIVSLGGKDGTSLGTLLSEAQGVWFESPHLMLVPAIIISLLMICFNLFGNGLRDAFNPSLRGVEE